jgi:hypothetical protein
MHLAYSQSAVRMAGSIGGRPALALDRTDPRLELREVETLDERPHLAGAVVSGQQALEVGRAEHHLAPGHWRRGFPRPAGVSGWGSAGGRSNSSPIPES